MWRQSLADSLCGQRDELLCAVSDWRQSSGRSESVAAAWVGLAANSRRIGSAEEEITALGGARRPRRYTATGGSILLFPVRRCFGVLPDTNRGCEAPCAHGDLDLVPGVRCPRACVSAHHQSYAASAR